MTTQEARKILGDVGKNLTDEQIEDVINLYRALARVFIQRHQKRKMDKSED